MPLTRRQFNRIVVTSLAGVSLHPALLAQSRVPVPRLGCQTDLKNAAAVKAAGGSWVGLSVAGWLDPEGPEDAFRAKIDAASVAPLPVLACNSFIRPKELKVTGPEANHDDVLAYCRLAFQRAQRAGVGAITFGSGGARRIPDDFDEERAFAQFIDFLQKLAPMAAEGDTAADLARAVDIINHVEIAELEGRRVPGTTGQDFRPYFKVLKAARYSGAIGIEGRFELAELSTGFAEITRQWNEA